MVKKKKKRCGFSKKRVKGEAILGMALGIQKKDSKW